MAPDAGRVKGVVFDIGNVIVRWNPRTLYARVFPDEAEREFFLTEVCTPQWHLAHDRGVTFVENRKPLLERFPEHAEAILDWERRWGEMFSGPIPETEAAIEALAARGVPMFGLTNMSHETDQATFAMSPAFRHLRDIVVSARVGLMKPDPAIFALSARRAGFAPDELLFVDDSQRNTDAAEAVGFAAHHFCDPAALWAALQAHGLL
ncbi:MAG TPA: HAD family phosphatase [Caulobacteraceae bacterium]|nr:HAD family phosphatase [Caulobacteraceae bacterium]